MLSGYGKVSQSSQRQDKRNAAQRGLDRVQAIFSSPYVVTAALTSFPINGTDSLPTFTWAARQTISRTHSFQLRAGHRVAYLYAETTVYRYITNSEVPKKWFQSNIDHIMKIYGREQRLTREDIFLGMFGYNAVTRHCSCDDAILVIGALDAPDYASFVSHSHSDGQVSQLRDM